MEALLVVFVPIVLLWFGLAFIGGRPPTPGPVLRSLSRASWGILKWLWKDRPEQGGPGRLKRPPFRYRE
jgi:hypothetical protein